MIFITKEDEIQIDVPLQSLYFYASWMPYNNKFINMISKIEEKHNMIFYAIDVDQFASQCKRFSVDSVPTVLVLNGGEEIKKITGLVLTSAFKSAFADIYSSVTSKNGESMSKKVKKSASKAVKKPVKAPVKKSAKKSKAVVAEKSVAPVVTLPVKTEAQKIWEAIANCPIQMFGLPNQCVSQHCTVVNVEPSKLYLIIRSSAVLPSLEAAIAPVFEVELVDKFVAVKRSKKM